MMVMRCGIVLFIYDRPQCTERVLESLKKNHIKELYVFQDGPGEKTNKSAWKKNEDIIRQIDWCDVVYEQNQSKASSLDSQIVYGINRVLREKDSIIVIEDDCIVSDDCIHFMEKCLTKYQGNRSIIDVGAYLEPIRVPEAYSLPVIAAGIPAGQVWGTWKDRWEEFQKEFSLIKQIGKAMKNNPMFQSCGYPIKKILTEYWMLSTWDLWWSIFVLLKEGISVRPACNKVYNIGFENPGTHTSGDSPWVVPISDKQECDKDFPEDIKVEPWAEEEFKKFYQDVNSGKTLAERQTYYRNCLEKWVELRQQGKSIGDILLGKNIRNIAIYGTGNLAKLLIDDLDEKVEVSYFIVSQKEEDGFMGYPVYGSKEKMPGRTTELILIVIPGYDLERIKEVMGDRFLAIYTVEALFSIMV